MLSNYFSTGHFVKMAWRNILKNHTSSLINIGGLAIGMTAMIFISLWINDEMSFNKYFKHYGRIGLACCMTIWMNAKIKFALIAHLVFFLLLSNLALGQNPKANTQNKFRLENGKYISFSKMDTFLKSQMDSVGIPGLSFALINDEHIVYHRTLGVTNVETNQRVSDGTIFDAASMTKTPFAYLVMRLVEKNILDLDKPLFTYLPYPDIAQDERYKLITARMVLSHTAGFPNWRFFNKDGKLDIKFTPGTQFLYSGEGYEYLANVIAHLLSIKKNDLQELFNEEIAKPLGMDKTYFTWNNWLEEHQATGHVDGKISDGYGIKKDKANFFASYSMQTEAMNYARFLIGMMTEKVLKKESHADMLKVQYPNVSKSLTEQWGLGIGIKHSEFGEEFFHGGFNLNFTSEFMFNKERKFGYVFFTNCNKGSEFNKRLLKFLKSNDE